MLAGGSIGVAIAALGARGLAAFGPEDVRVADPGVSIPMLAFAIAASRRHRAGLRHLSGVAGVPIGSSGHAPGRGGAPRSVGAGPAGCSADAGRRRDGAGDRPAGLGGTSAPELRDLMRADRGYAIDNVITADLSLFGDRYAESASRIAFDATSPIGSAHWPASPRRG